ncbi:IclR family transcriptional regulator [Raoultella ornithinolytica]|uniref:IclR family transcriptional regulator n=1 Tax=Raoultella ornithinolytica TaxID=54291 RepID=UPI00115927B2|nr:IclR family transcriptional regulator [Raoultella ornithinolytica]
MEIRSVTKAVRVIEALADTDTPLGVTELARITDLDKSSVSRLLKTLVSAGYVAQDPNNRTYELGLTLLHLGQKVLKRVDLRALCRESLDKLAHITGECAHIAILVNNQSLYLDQATPTRGISIDAPVGTLAPLHCTALGKVLFAFQDEKAKLILLRTFTFEAFTRRSITDKTHYITEIEKVKQSLIAYDDEEFSIGVKCIAAPIFDHENSIAAAIGISGPSPRMTDDKLFEWTHLLREEAKIISFKMGWQG